MERAGTQQGKRERYLWEDVANRYEALLEGKARIP